MSEAGQNVRDRTFDFAVATVKLCRTLDAKPGISRALTKQILRSGTSIGANLEEANGVQSRRDFIAKIAISLKEARETHYWLRLLAATNTGPLPQLLALTAEADELRRILAAILNNTRRNSQ